MQRTNAAKEANMTNPKTPWDLDIRVRDRNLKKGVLEDAEVQNYLKELPDLSANAELVTLPQPAITGSATATPQSSQAAPAQAAPAAPALAVAPVPPASGTGVS
jgi:hypothetical protein